jgi:hypothetical protein
MQRSLPTSPAILGALASVLLAACGGSKTTAPVPVTELSVTTPTEATVAGVAIVPAIVVTAKDGTTTASGFDGPITLALDANPGGATLSGTLTVNALNGVATFSNVSLNRAASSYTLTATSGTLLGRSGFFAVTAADATTLVKIAGDNQSAPISTTLADSLSVTVTDAFGNFVPGVTVAWAVATGGGTVSRSTSAVTLLGSANTSWKLGATAGTQTVTATVAGMAGSPLTFTATATPVAEAEAQRRR